MHDAILSVSPYQDFLDARRIALEASGFPVISVSNESAARFEIQMGRCGVLVLCHRLHQDVNHSLSQEFRKYCPDGIIVGIVGAEPDALPKQTDICVKYSENAETLVAALLKHPVARRFASHSA
jgi:hypothetical protein